MPKKCRKFRTVEVAYSSTTEKAGKIWHFLKILLRQKHNTKKHFADILSLSNDLNVAEFYSVAIEKVK